MAGIKISKELHTRMKAYCLRNGYKIQGWAERILNEELDRRTFKKS